MFGFKGEGEGDKNLFSVYHINKRWVLYGRQSCLYVGSINHTERIKFANNSFKLAESDVELIFAESFSITTGTAWEAKLDRQKQNTKYGANSSQSAYLNIGVN